jgi:hypothetical protein
VDSSGILYAQDVYDGFSEEIIQMIRVEAALVEVVPDPAASVEDMEQYGYYYKGMLPVRGETATEFFTQGMKEQNSRDTKIDKPSVLGRLKEKQELLAKTEKKEAPAPEKKPEHDMP